MPDVQASHDARNVAIDKVGVKNITYPITLKCPATGGNIHTVAQVNMYVGLPHYQKGMHMSRFLEVLNKCTTSRSGRTRSEVCNDMKERLEAEEAHLELRFPTSLTRRPRSAGAPGKIDIQVTFECSSDTEEDFLIMGVRDAGDELLPLLEGDFRLRAYNQRCQIEARVRFALGKMMDRGVVRRIDTRPARRFLRCSSGRTRSSSPRPRTTTRSSTRTSRDLALALDAGRPRGVVSGQQ